MAWAASPKGTPAMLMRYRLQDLFVDDEFTDWFLWTVVVGVPPAKLAFGVKGTIRQAVARHARYRGLAKTHLEHVYSAIAFNLIRLDAWFHGLPIDRTRTSHLPRLELALAA
ncbi:hypothetical protein [Dactylosporangium sp. NPDC048998]|uniref:hypothetical protein n=1 Tax=Dactylosporangium sp. NPDC048998 TaxID=3363976 RepID=UPI00371A466B